MVICSNGIPARTFWDELYYEQENSCHAEGWENSHSSGTPTEKYPWQNVGGNLDQCWEETVQESVTVKVARVQWNTQVGNGDGEPVGTWFVSLSMLTPTHNDLHDTQSMQDLTTKLL